MSNCRVEKTIFHNHISEFPFDLVHRDLWGPFSVATVNGYKYFFNIVDDYSRCTWVYLLKLKAETQSLLTQFYTMVETQFNMKIDNGIKFLMKDFFQNQGCSSSIELC